MSLIMKCFLISPKISNESDTNVGVVLNGVGQKNSYGYSYGYKYRL